MATERRVAGCALALAAAAAVIAGCGSSTTTTKKAATSGGAKLSYVDGVVAQYTALPRFTLSAAAFDASKLAGKTIFDIPVSSSIPYDSGIDQAQAAVAKRFGIKYTDYSNQGQVSQWVQGFTQALARHPDLILLLGTSPYSLTTQLRTAKTSHIPVLSTHAVDPTMPAPAAAPQIVDQLFTTGAKLDADYVTSATRGKANVIILTSNDFQPSQYMVSAIKQEFSTYCGSGCTTTTVNVPVADWATRIQGAMQSALIADPGANYVIPLYDGMCQWVVPAISETHRVGKVFIATYNGTPFVLKDIEDGNVVKMDVAENLDWLGWADMDAAMRALAGLKPPVNEQTGLRMFTKSNVSQAGTPPTVNRGLGDAYIAGYNKLWSGK